LLVVHRWRSGQPVKAAPKVTIRPGGMRRVTPAGQVTVSASSSGVKSPVVNPPGLATSPPERDSRRILTANDIDA
jgi:hypothetical protein